MLVELHANFWWFTIQFWPVNHTFLTWWCVDLLEVELLVRHVVHLNPTRNDWPETKVLQKRVETHRGASNQWNGDQGSTHVSAAAHHLIRLGYSWCIYICNIYTYIIYYSWPGWPIIFLMKELGYTWEMVLMDIDGVRTWDISWTSTFHWVRHRWQICPFWGTSSVGERNDIELFEPPELHKVPGIPLTNLPVLLCIPVWFVGEPGPWSSQMWEIMIRKT